MASWNLITSVFGGKETPSPLCLLRIKREILAFFNEAPPGIFIVPDEKDMTLIHALITGPADTPYEGGFFYMIIRCPSDYPIRPPSVELMTTGEGQVRFNPNLYSGGQVCLSILGTWHGPSWSPAQNLRSVLISIRSLMNEKPYHNEPGYETECLCERGKSDRYNEIIRHETLRVAVCDMLEGTTADSRHCPKLMRDTMEGCFPGFYRYYEATAKANLYLDRKSMQDPHDNWLFGDNRGIFNYGSILNRLQKIKEKLDAKQSEILSD